MKVIEASNVNIAYAKALTYLHDFGITRQSRAGEVLVVPEPVTTHYRNPRERVLFSAQRDANPFFHLFEALWMLTGADDVTLPTYFVKRMLGFSDDGEKFHGAYGHRWRHMPGEDLEGGPGLDQLEAIVHLLQLNPDDRRVMLQIWDAARDLAYDSFDIPCNDMVKFQSDVDLVDRLNMIVFNRSNDIIWGCYGANAVQFSILQEYLAARIGCQVGWYEQVSTNWHAYASRWNDYYPNTDPFPFQDPYRVHEGEEGSLLIETLVTDPDTFDAECAIVINHARNAPHIIGDFITEGMHNRFFHRVCNPMLWAYATYRQGNLKNAIETMEQAILNNGEIDWLVAGERWMRRRAASRMLVGEKV